MSRSSSTTSTRFFSFMWFPLVFLPAQPNRRPPAGTWRTRRRCPAGLLRSSAPCCRMYCRGTAGPSPLPLLSRDLRSCHVHPAAVEQHPEDAVCLSDLVFVEVDVQLPAAEAQ